MRAIELERFQAFRDRVRIPFNRLTLLYGPNSAGKSAVIDAIQLFADFWQGRMPERTDSLSRWLHSSGSNKARTFRVAMEFSPNLFVSPSGSVRHALSSFGIWRPGRARLPKIEYDTVSIRNDDKLRKSIPAESSYTVALEFRGDWVEEIQVLAEGALLFSMSSASGWRQAKNRADIETFLATGSICINLRHRIIRRVGISEKQIAAWIDASKLPLADDDLDKKQGSQSPWMSTYDGNLVCQVQWPRLVRSPRDLISIDPSPETINYGPEKAALFDVLVWITGWVDSDLISGLRSARYAAHVPATRPIPDGKSLLFLLNGALLVDQDDGEDPPAWIEPYESDDALALMAAPKIQESQSFPAYKRLAQHHAYKILARICSEALGKVVEVFPDVDGNEWKDANLDFVNSVLADHLFLDSGYQVEIEMRFLVGSKVVSDAVAAEASIFDFVNSPILATVSLRDAHGRKVAFSDVGSGISNVLPMLVQLATSPYVFIEEPETHLHPALQSALGDVLLAAGRSSKLIVETHSEHLLLRLLRRIRETSEGGHAKDGLALTPSELGVVYLNPLPDGATECRWLTVTPHGEFYEPWPRGFFDERYKDLFDE